MKNFGRYPILSFGSMVLAALWLLTAAAEAANPGAAKVKKVVGSASYTDAKGNGPVREGDILMQGATITTGAGSYVDLDMGVNGNALRIEADSTLTLNKLDYLPIRGLEPVVNTELEVKKGSAVANVVNKLSKASKYEIKTPAGVAGIRGTVLRAGTTRIVCLIGRISFVPVAGGGVQLVITGGAGFQQGTAGTVRVNSVETTGLARTACSLTANTLANMVSQAVQQFTAAIAAEAATEAGKTGGNPSAEAAAVAKAVLAQLVQEVQQAAANAPPAVRAQVQAAAAALQNNTESISATAAASGAAAGVINNGGTAQQAKAAANAAASASTNDPRVASAAANNVTLGAINRAILQGQSGSGNTTESLVNDTKPATGVTTGGNATGTGTGTGVGTTVGGQQQTIQFVDPNAGNGEMSSNKTSTAIAPPGLFLPPARPARPVK